MAKLRTAVALALLVNCVGTIGGDGAEETLVDPSLVPQGGARRLSATEMATTLKDLLEDDGLPVFETLPVDPRTPFDNDYREQVASQGLIDAADFLAQRAIDRLLADTPRRDRVVGCVPEGVDDETCLRDFISRFGRRALRRPLGGEEIDEYVSRSLPFAVEANDFYTAVDTVLWEMLQDPEFLYRPEIGAAVQPGIRRLSDFEIAARLSYFLWGSTPDDALLDRAAAGLLHTPEQRREAALVMLEDDRAKRRIARFHAMWLGYEILPHAGQLGDDMRAETSALIDRVIFEEQRAWQDLFRLDETFVSDFLADHYGLTPPHDPAGDWVSYGDSGRAGLLSHGSFLSIGAKFNDTSPVRRGLVVRERLLCQEIADPPPNVDVDQPVVVENAVCKPERFAAHSQGGCANCHRLMDPIGFGLESYDQFGVFREFEPDNPDTVEDESQCAIDGEGKVDDLAFNGPAALGALAVDTGMANECVTKQLYRFVFGRSELDFIDERVVGLVNEELGDGDFTFIDLALEIVAHPSFAHRSED